MRAVLDAKFKNARLAQLLLATEDSFLLEHNPVVGRDKQWSDNHRGDGANWLGMQLMLVRDELVEQSERTWTSWLEDAFRINFADRKQIPRHSQDWQVAVQSAADIVNTRYCGSPATASPVYVRPGCSMPIGNRQQNKYCGMA